MGESDHRVIDAGTADGWPAPAFDAELVQVGAGTPARETLRLVRPRRGPDPLSNGHGRAGALHPRCRHRGSTLFDRTVEADGIRWPRAIAVS